MEDNLSAIGKEGIGTQGHFVLPSIKEVSRVGHYFSFLSAVRICCIIEQPLQIPKHHTFRSFRICIYQTGTKEWDKGFGGHLSTAVIKRDGWENNSDIVRISSHSVVKTALNGIQSMVPVRDVRRRKGKRRKRSKCLFSAHGLLVLLPCFVSSHHFPVQKCNQPYFISKKLRLCN